MFSLLRKKLISWENRNIACKILNMIEKSLIKNFWKIHKLSKNIKNWIVEQFKPATSWLPNCSDIINLCIIKDTSLKVICLFTQNSQILDSSVFLEKGKTLILSEYFPWKLKFGCKSTTLKWFWWSIHCDTFCISHETLFSKKALLKFVWNGPNDIGCCWISNNMRPVLPKKIKMKLVCLVKYTKLQNCSHYLIMSTKYGFSREFWSSIKDFESFWRFQ